MSQLAVIFLVDRRGWVLLQERDEHAPRSPDKWGMVGGHVEPGEDVEVAAYRELAEETGVVLPPGSLQLWKQADFSYADGHLGDYRIYVAGTTLRDEDIVLGEGRQIVFVEPSRTAGLDLSESCAHFLPLFLASACYRTLATPGQG